MSLPRYSIPFKSVGAICGHRNVGRPACAERARARGRTGKGDLRALRCDELARNASGGGDDQTRGRSGGGEKDDRLPDRG